LLVSDLQGFILNTRKYLLTDPAIICPINPNRFSLTNIKDGIESFFHVCLLY